MSFGCWISSWPLYGRALLHLFIFCLASSSQHRSIIIHGNRHWPYVELIEAWKVLLYASHCYSFHDMHTCPAIIAQQRKYVYVSYVLGNFFLSGFLHLWLLARPLFFSFSPFTMYSLIFSHNLSKATRKRYCWGNLRRQARPEGSRSWGKRSSLSVQSPLFDECFIEATQPRRQKLFCE